MATFESIFVLDLAEVLISQNTTECFSYGEVLRKNPDSILVNFITKKDDIYLYEDESYEIEYESINFCVGTKNGTMMHAAWHELGFEFRSEAELLRLEEIESIDDDEDWSLQKELETDDEYEESQSQSEECEEESDESTASSN